MCGCMSNVTTSKNTSTTVNKISVSTTTTTPLKSSINCDITYEEIRDLDLKVLQILRKEKDDFLMQINRQLIYWFRNINNECPNLEEYNIIKQYVENEYTKYYP